MHRPTITVWPLPSLSEEELKHLFMRILDGCVSIAALQVHDESDIMVCFPQDMMKFGLGQDLVIDVGISADLPRAKDLCRQVADQIRNRIEVFFMGRNMHPEIQAQGHLVYRT